MPSGTLFCKILSPSRLVKPCNTCLIGSGSSATCLNPVAISEILCAFRRKRSTIISEIPCSRALAKSFSFSEIILSVFSIRLSAKFCKKTFLSAVDSFATSLLAFLTFNPSSSIIVLSFFLKIFDENKSQSHVLR